MLKRILLITLFCLLAACDETILHELTEQQANKAFIVLSRVGIESSKKTDGVNWTLQVAKQDASMALAELEAARVFVPEKDADEGGGFGFIQSAEQRAHAIEESQSRKVADTLKRIPGVLDARVHLYRSKRDVLEAPSAATQGSASVLLIVDTGLVPEDTAVKSLVAGALGLLPDAVSVIVSESKIATTPPVVETPEVPTPTAEVVVAQQSSEQENTNWNPRTVYLGTMALTLLVVLGILFYFRRKRDNDNSIVANQDDSITQPLSVLNVHEVF